MFYVNKMTQIVSTVQLGVHNAYWRQNVHVQMNNNNQIIRRGQKCNNVCEMVVKIL